MNFTKQHRSYAVGAQFIGAPPIYRPGERIDGSLADKSAVRASMRRLRYGRLWSLKFIIGAGRDESRPYEMGQV